MSLLCFGVYFTLQLYLGPHMGPAPSHHHVFVIFWCQNMATAHRGLWSSTWGLCTLPPDKNIPSPVLQKEDSTGLGLHDEFLILGKLTFIPIFCNYHTSCMNMYAWIKARLTQVPAKICLCTINIIRRHSVQHRNTWKVKSYPSKLQSVLD